MIDFLDKHGEECEILNNRISYIIPLPKEKEFKTNHKIQDFDFINENMLE